MRESRTSTNPVQGVVPLQKVGMNTKRNRLMAGLASCALAVAATVGIGLATATAAQAQTVHEYYSINTWGVCQWQGHLGAAFYNQFNPYSWFCFNGSYPVSFTYEGGLNLEGWCNTYHPGSHAEILGGTVYDWYCVVTTTV